MNWQPRRFRPQHIQVVRLTWQGYSQQEIAEFLGVSSGHVSQVLGCDEAQAMLKQLTQHAISSMDEVQDEVQLVAPLVMREKIRLALDAQDERVRNIACTDILAIAGHTPVKKLQIERNDPRQDELERKTPEELRAGLRSLIGLKDEKGADGKLLN
jgi:predicted transcriptional regulator